MTLYIIKCTDRVRQYVAPPGSKKSYTDNILKARFYMDRYKAEEDCCPENEVVMHVELHNLLHIT